MSQFISTEHANEAFRDSFDEGIHPEYMLPDYQPKRKSFIKKFGQFLLNQSI